MCKFINIFSSSNSNLFILRYIFEVENCYSKYKKYLQDDFAPNNINDFIKSFYPYFWIITDYYDNFMGFVGLDNFVGNGKVNFSAELTTCFDRCAWGNFTRYCAKIFLKKCFDEFGLYKIKSQIFPDNFRIKTLLKYSGFEHEATLPKETIRARKPQDIEIYSLYRKYYYGG